MESHFRVRRGVSKALVAMIIIIIVVILAVVGIYYSTTTTTTTSPTAATTPTKITTTTSPTAATTPTKTTTVMKRTLRVLQTAPIQTDPAIAIDWVSLRAVQNIYDALIELGSNNAPDPELSLAYKWEVSSDGLTYTFYLRKGVKFHSGRELTSKDVIFTLDRLLKIGQGPAFVFAPYIDSYKAIDDYTVQIKLKKPYGPFIYACSLLYIVDSEEVKAHMKSEEEFAKEWLRSHDAGSGPYMIKEHVFGEKLVLELFKDYWGYVNPKAPEEVTLLPPPDPAAQVTMFLRGDIDITYALPTETVLEMMGKKGVNLSKQMFGQQFLLVLNTKKPPLDDVHFRRALAYAFDYDQGLKAYVPGYIWPSIGPVASYLPGAPKDLKFYTRNLTAAREELKKSKYYNQLDKYTIEVWWCAEVPVEEKYATIFATSVKELDPKIKVEVVKKPWASMVDALSKVESTPHITVLLSTPWFPEAGNVLHLKFHSVYAGKSIIHVSWLLNSTIDKMIDDALSTVDDTARFKKYREIVKVLNDMVPEIAAGDYADIVLYWGYYIKWPAGEGKPPYGTQYMYNFRFMEVYPEKKAELFGTKP